MGPFSFRTSLATEPSQPTGARVRRGVGACGFLCLRRRPCARYLVRVQTDVAPTSRNERRRHFAAATMPAPRPALSPHLGWPHWLAALLLGLMLVLLVLIVSWFLHAVAPVDALLNVTMLETDAPPAARSPDDMTPTLKASLDRTMADGKTLAVQLASLQAEFESKVAWCKPTEQPPPLPADRWAKRDLSMLKGCWVLGHDVTSWRGEIGSPEREDNCTTKAARMCFDEGGHGQIVLSAVCPIAGTIYCASPITARFANDGTFTTTTLSAQCQRGPPTQTASATGSCRRIDDYHALCRRTNFIPQFDRPGARFEETEFRREP